MKQKTPDTSVSVESEESVANSEKAGEDLEDVEVGEEGVEDG